MLKEEVADAVFSIKANSAPGADGFTGFFLQKYRNVIGDLVTQRCSCFLSKEECPWNGIIQSCVYYQRR